MQSADRQAGDVCQVSPDAVTQEAVEAQQPPGASLGGLPARRLHGQQRLAGSGGPCEQGRLVVLHGVQCGVLLVDEGEQLRPAVPAAVTCRRRHFEPRPQHLGNPAGGRFARTGFISGTAFGCEMRRCGPQCPDDGGGGISAQVCGVQHLPVMPLGRGRETVACAHAGEPGCVAHWNRPQAHVAADQVLAHAVHGILRLLERPARRGRLAAELPGAVGQAADRAVRLHLDDQHPEPGDDDDEVGLTLNLPDVVGDREGMQHDPVPGCGAGCQRCVEFLLAWRRGLRAVRRHHSSQRALRSLNSTLAWRRGIT